MPTAKGSLVDCLKDKTKLNLDCFASVSSFSYVTKMEASITKNAGGVFADSTQWFCSARTCPPIIKNTPVMIDTQHMSDAMSATFSQIFGKWLWSQPWAGSALTYKVAAPSRSILSGSNANVTSYTTILENWQGKIRAALKLTKVPPDMNPPFSKLERGKQWDACMMPKSNGITCEFGNSSSKKTAVIIGDSFALAIYPTILNSLDLKSWHIVGLNQGQCMVASVTPWTNGKPDFTCTKHRDWTFAYLAKLHPDLLILSDNAGHEISQSGKILVSGRTAFWAKQLEISLSKLSKISAKFFYFGLPTQQKSLADCTDAQLNLSSSCLGHPSGNSGVRRIQKGLTLKYGGVFIDTETWLCAAFTCPPIIDNSPVYFDGSHMSNTFAQKLAPLFSSLLREYEGSTSNQPLSPSPRPSKTLPSSYSALLDQ